MPDSSLSLVVNPTAGGGRAGRLWPQIRAHLGRLGLEVQAAFTRAPGEATHLARQAVQAGHHTVVAVGGDGTVNEVVNGLIAPGEPQARARLGLILVGRGSDLARTIGLSREVQEACERLVHPQPRRLDLGLAGFIAADGSRQQRFFINVAGIGFDAAVVRRANRTFRRIRGTVPYLASLVLTLITWKNRPAEILLDDRPPLHACIYLAVVGNGCYFGGGMYVTPDADPGDGLLDVCIANDIGKLEFLRIIPRVYRGTHVTHPAVDMYRARRVEVRSPYPLAGELDGEEAGLAPLLFEVVPDALEVLV